MVAVGSSHAPGTVLLSANPQTAVPIQTGWHVREGRNQEFVIWEDALNDMLPRIGLTRAAANEMPPERPAGDSLSADRMILWGQALVQYQDEGTALFDAIRPSIIIDGPYAGRDVRLISGWKKDGVKDGRSLLRWALSYVDRSSIGDQMQVLTEMNAMRLSAQGSLFDLTEHCFGMWELWLSLANSDREQPASFFRQLLISMPTTPEGPVVHVRRFLVDMLELDTSPLLKDIDGEKGLFNKMGSYGRSLGMSDKAPRLGTLNAAGLPPGRDKWNPDWNSTMTTAGHSHATVREVTASASGIPSSTCATSRREVAVSTSSSCASTTRPTPARACR